MAPFVDPEACCDCCAGCSFFFLLKKAMILALDLCLSARCDVLRSSCEGETANEE